jgi:UDP-GlcNAc:undecaprenyl-phosphate GlcNAc-1-phosphate transferase
MLPLSRQAFFANGMRWAYILSVSFAVAFCLTPICRWLAQRLNIMDIPGNRKSHLQATPLLGGAAVFTAFVAALAANGIFSPQLLAVIMTAAVLFVMGVLDDVREVSAGFKLLVQLGCAIYVLRQGVVVDTFPLKLGMVSVVLNSILTVLWIVGITNAMNFFDGMDGMAGGLGVIIAFFLGSIATQTAQTDLGWIAAAMMGSCLGFLPYNFLKAHRATIFLGDAGSTVIGFVLACLAAAGEWSNNAVAAMVSPLLIFWVLIFDMIHITIDRIASGKVTTIRQWLEYVGHDHLHHRLAIVLGSPKRSVLFIYLMAACLGTSAFVLRNAETIEAMLLLFQATLIVVLVTILERRGRLLSMDITCGRETATISDENGFNN